MAISTPFTIIDGGRWGQMGAVGTDLSLNLALHGDESSALTSALTLALTLVFGQVLQSFSSFLLYPSCRLQICSRCLSYSTKPAHATARSA